MNPEKLISFEKKIADLFNEAKIRSPFISTAIMKKF